MTEAQEPARHELKTWPEPFTAIVEGRKTFEFRKDDRGFAEGDSLVLQEYDPDSAVYSGRETTRRAGYVVRGPAFGVPEGFAVLSLMAGDEYEQEMDDYPTEAVIDGDEAAL